MKELLPDSSSKRISARRVFIIGNVIHATAIGKKNWLFIGGEDTGERSAILYTLIESARRHGHEPFAYLKDVLDASPA